MVGQWRAPDGALNPDDARQATHRLSKTLDVEAALGSAIDGHYTCFEGMGHLDLASTV